MARFANPRGGGQWPNPQRAPKSVAVRGIAADGSVQASVRPLTLLLTVASLVAGCRSTAGAEGTQASAHPSQARSIYAVGLPDGTLVFDGKEPASLQCAALSPSACYDEAVAAWTSDGGPESERRALAMLHQACLRGFEPSCAEIHGPRPLEVIVPDYPQALLNSGASGTVRAVCTLPEGGGFPSHCQIVESVPGMDAAVLQALSATHFAPATFFGRPLQVDYFIGSRLETRTTISR
jgi:hypothetical protein